MEGPEQQDPKDPVIALGDDLPIFDQFAIATSDGPEEEDGNDKWDGQEGCKMVRRGVVRLLAGGLARGISDKSRNILIRNSQPTMSFPLSHSNRRLTIFAL